MRHSIFDRVSKADFVVVDSLFPQKEPFAFRNTEINQYFERIKNFASYTMHPMAPDSDAWFPEAYGITYEQYKQNKKGYLKHHPENRRRIHYLQENRPYSFSLAYSFFLGETYVLLPFYEKNNIPFVFVLYPGGRFGLNHDGSDRMLKTIFKSKCFRGVIVTQKITKNYLLNKRMCPAGKIDLIYGGFVQFRPKDVRPKRLYGQDKNTFDICFVAAKYSERGVDKGYDLFIKAAKQVAGKCPDVRFHVVGGFDENEIDVSDIHNRITC